MEKKARKTKVLFVITKSNFGGAQKYVYDLATSLPQDRFEIKVILGGKGPLATILEGAGVHTISLLSLGRDVNILGDIKSFFELLRIVKHEKPDVLHLNSSKIGIMGGLVGRITKTPRIVFTAHGWAFNENRSRISRFIIKVISWTTILLAHKTIAVSQAICRDLTWPGAQKRMCVIYNGIRPVDTIPRPKARAQLETLGDFAFPKHGFVFGTIAELHPNKGLSYAIQGFAEVAKKYPGTRYIIIGGGQDHEKLQNLIQELGLGKQVILLGFITDAARFLEAFDCFILPSTTEALAYVLLEAGSVGLPVIASNVGGLPEIIGDQETGILIPSRNHQAITQAMELILTQESFRAQLANNLKNRVTQKFSLIHSLESTISLYTQKP